ncbi:glutathione peroxidase [Loa loa]|uniref:Glutathione peroxidase n=1 Tax=Loa loa TaxID=7209 RepID=A0A1I7W3U3_LOALO|nr:glutathione peroxidase [Loa loa]EFO17883.2 glutathione peroxidase [Loa loa]
MVFGSFKGGDGGGATRGLARKFYTFTRFTGTIAASETIYDFTVKDVDGKEVKLDKYRGKPVVIVNVASQCKLADSNYRELKELQKFYKDEGLVVAAFPCNQFGSQEPSDGVDIKKSVKEKYHYEPDIYAKIEVNGENTHPLYNFLKEKQGGTFGKKIKWNFTKFLIDQDGHPVKRYAPTTSPMTIKHDIDSLTDGNK